MWKIQKIDYWYIKLLINFDKIEKVIYWFFIKSVWI